LDAVRSTPSVKVAINMTSDKCYENLETGQAYREDDRLGGKDPYSASKACAELVFRSYFQSFFEKQKNVSIATVRAGNVIGGGDWAKDRIIPDCFRAWAKGEKVATRNPGSVRPWQHVLEPLSGYLWLGAKLAQNHDTLHGESFNFGPLEGSAQTVAQLLGEFQKLENKAQWTQDLNADTSKKEAGLLNLNTDKAKKILGWQASLNFQDTIAMTSKWYWSYYSGKPDAALTTNQISEYCRLSADRGQSWARE
jgi:CDP-glucose 4,6-dehydratase